MGRAAEPAEVTDVIAFFAGSDARFVARGVLRVDAGLRAGSGQGFVATGSRVQSTT